MLATFDGGEFVCYQWPDLFGISLHSTLCQNFQRNQLVNFQDKIVLCAPILLAV